MKHNGTECDERAGASSSRIVEIVSGKLDRSDRERTAVSARPQEVVLSKYTLLMLDSLDDYVKLAGNRSPFVSGGAIHEL